MPEFKVKVKTSQRGAIFNAAQTKMQAAEMVNSINKSLAQEGVNRVRAELNRVLQNPTGFYSSKIVTDRSTSSWRTWDSGVVYGGWLEGLAPQNRTTRFKGYATFRRVKQQLDADAERLAQPMVDKFVNEMNR